MAVDTNAKIETNLNQTCQQKERKKSENCGSVTQLGVWGAL